MWLSKSFFVYAEWCTGTLPQIYYKINELSSSRVSQHPFWSQSNWEFKDSSKKTAETGENNMQSRAEMNPIIGLKQHHFQGPPVSLQVNAKLNAGSGGCPSWSYEILDTVWYICCSLLVNKSTYTVHISMAKMVPKRNCLGTKACLIMFNSNGRNGKTHLNRR